MKIKLSAFADEAAVDLQGQIDAMKKNQIDLLELRSIDGNWVLDFTLEQAKGYAEVLEKNGIKVWAIGSPIGKVDINVDINEYLEKVKHICELAKIFNTKKVRMFSFFDAYDNSDKVMEYLKKMLEVANEYNVEFYHENEKDIYGDVAERVLEIMEKVPGLKFVYDPANFIQCGEDSTKTLDLLHSKIDYFHIKDVIAETGELVPPGCGSGNIEELVRRIKDDKVLTMEPHLAVFEAYSTIDNTEMKHKYCYKSNIEAFDAAVSAMKGILVKCGYKEVGTEFIK